MKGIDECLGWLIENGHEIAIISGGMQETATQIAKKYTSSKPWTRRWGGIEKSQNECKKYQNVLQKPHKSQKFFPKFQISRFSI